MNERRLKAEALVYKVMDKLDKTGQNTTYYKSLFSNMNDNQFDKFCRRDFPFRFHTRPFEIEPQMSDVEKALEVLKVPLLEPIALKYLYEDKEGKPVLTKPCLVIYIHVKKMKQFITKKNSMSTGIDERDMKTGLLVSIDKNGKTSDREMESLSVMGLNKTMEELSTWRADYMGSKTQAYQTINLTGRISSKDLNIESAESLSKNMLNVYFLGSNLYSNILNRDYMLPLTLKNRQRKVEREVQ